MGRRAPGTPSRARGPYRELVAGIAATVAFTLIRLASASGASGGLTAAQILQRVSGTYRNMMSFRYVEKTSNAEAAGNSLSSAEISVAESKPGRVRLTDKTYLLVSDGESTWTYLRRANLFTEIAAAPLLNEEWVGDPLSGNYLSGYLSIAREQAVPMDVRGGDLKGSGRPIECYVIATRGSGYSGWARKLWVDKARFLVWRDEYWRLATLPENPSSSGLTVALERISTGPEPAETFEFVPPKGARRVASVPYMKLNSQWQDLAFASTPAAAGLEAKVGVPAPDFETEALEGSKVSLNDLRGKIVVLDFWASWCKPCREELAAVQKLHGELASQGVAFLGIDDESPETVKSFAKAHGYTFPILLDTEQKAHQLYGVRWAPTTVVINRKGKIAAQYIGAGGEAQLLKALKEAGLKLPAAKP